MFSFYIKSSNHVQFSAFFSKTMNVDWASIFINAFPKKNIKICSPLFVTVNRTATKYKWGMFSVEQK